MQERFDLLLISATIRQFISALVVSSGGCDPAASKFLPLGRYSMKWQNPRIDRP